MQISIIVPTLDEEQTVAATLSRARGPLVREIIVVDGGSRDRTRDVAAALADRVLRAPRGRAHQLNAGAAAAAAEILLFLHADTVPPPGFDAAIVAALSDANTVAGRFDVALMPSSPLLSLTAALINRRSRLTRIATGDQAIFVRRAVFVELNGFPPFPLMEDIAISRLLKRRGQIACLRDKVVTSSRRWRRDGVVRTILLMWSLRLLYYFGVAPERLARVYRNTR